MSNKTQLSLKKQLIDQSAHMIAAIAILALLISYPAWWSAMIAGSGIGLIREISEGDSIVTKDKFDLGFWSIFDIVFWALGGLVAWMVFS